MDRWKKTDEMLEEMLIKYNKLNKYTQDEIQNIFDSYDISKENLFSISDKKTLNKVNRMIDDYVEDNEIDTYTKYRINKVYGKSRIKNNDILDFLIFFCFLRERNKLTKYENKMFQELANIEYKKAQEEVYDLIEEEKEVISFKESKVDEIISSPNPKGYIWNDYIMATLLYNSNQIYRQALIDIQQNKIPDIASDVYQNILKSQRNKYLSIKEDGTISGDLELESLYLVNSSIKEGYLKADSKAKVRFIAEIDKRTTDMCESLNNQIFNVNDWNTYQRYSADDGRIVTYKTFGLEVGANLPPINNHFHWCRSSITYLFDKEIKGKYKNITNKWLKSNKSKNNRGIIKLPEGNIFEYKGKKYIIDNKKVKYDFNSKEIKFAEWLSNEKNIDIQLNPVINEPEGINVADLTIVNDLYDMKIVNGKGNQLIYHNIYGKEKQACNFLFEATDSPLSLSELVEQVGTVYSRTDVEWVKIIGIKKDENFIIFERQ